MIRLRAVVSCYCVGYRTGLLGGWATAINTAGFFTLFGLLVSIYPIHV
jgi:hypothetical protein